MGKSEKTSRQLLISMLILLSTGNINSTKNKKQFDFRSSSVKKIYHENFRNFKIENGSPIDFRSSSVKKNYHKNFRNFKIENGSSILENPEFKKQGKHWVLLYSGPALDQLLEKYEIVMDEKYNRFLDKFGLDGRVKMDNVNAGHTAAVFKCKKKGTNEIYAVKCETNPKNTGIITKNNTTEHVDDNENESRFYNESQMWWSNRPWIIKKYYKFHDDNVSYTVTDWCEGVDLKNWFSVSDSLATTSKKLAVFVKQFNVIIDDMTRKGKINTGLHKRNIMVTPNWQLKVVDNGKYRNIQPLENSEEINAKQLIDILNLPQNKLFWSYLVSKHEHKVNLKFRSVSIILKDDGTFKQTEKSDSYELQLEDVLENLSLELAALEQNQSRCKFLNFNLNK